MSRLLLAPGGIATQLEDILRPIESRGALATRESTSSESPAGAVAVAARDLRKSFVVPGERRTTVKELIARGRAPGEAEHVEALRGMSLDVPQGEFLGIVGRNGSGKSTFLRIVAGIYQADGGELITRGRVSPFIEMGVGFRPELSARDNVLLNAAVLGIPRAEARERLPEVLAFADLEGFAEQKLKNFSSGMAVRLAFASALQAKADILLLDEVLAVGDEAFQEKCHGEFERFKGEGRTVLFVTHDMAAVERFCDRAVLLDGGRVAVDGSPGEVAAAYREVNRRGQAPHPAPGPAPAPSSRNRRAGRRGLLGEDRRQLARLATSFARADIAVHYEDSVLGYLWSVLRPLGLFTVLYFVFSRAANLADGVEAYPVYLLTAVVLWTFFTEVTSEGVIALTGARDTLRRMRLPSASLPLAVLLKSAFNLAVNLVAVGIFVAASGVEPRLSWLEVPFLILFLALFALGLAMLLSVLYVRFRDVQQAWSVAQQFIFFSSPILYVASRYPPSLQEVLDLSPLSVVFTQMRHAMLDPTAPTAAEAAGGMAMLAVPVAIVAATLAGGLWLFSREAPRVAERL